MDKVSRGTKCFSAFHGKGLNGAFPRGFIPWLREMGWLGENACHLCSGTMEDGFTVDVRPEMNPSLVADASDTGLEDNRFDYVTVDPPYSEDLAGKLYGTKDNYKSINAFVKEATRIVKHDGIVVSLSYEIPKIPKGAELLAVWGVYTVPHTAFMRCCAVFRKVNLVKEPELF